MIENFMVKPGTGGMHNYHEGMNIFALGNKGWAITHPLFLVMIVITNNIPII